MFCKLASAGECLEGRAPRASSTAKRDSDELRRLLGKKAYSHRGQTVGHHVKVCCLGVVGFQLHDLGGHVSTSRGAAREEQIYDQ
jgi:hypothetical protein